MKLVLLRLHSTKATTHGALFRVDLGQSRHWLCWTLEDQHRDVKVKGDTRIPAGTYDVTLRTEGGHHERYGQKFGGMHRGMLWLQDVPNFQYVLIHIGNTDDDTAGCLLVGNTVSPGRIGDSTAAYTRIYPALAEAAATEGLSLTIADYDAT